MAPQFSDLSLFQKALYRIVRSFGIGLARLPFSLLVGISCATALILENMVRYRKAVIKKNIASAFPKASPQEQKRIAHDFYKHLSTLLLFSPRWAYSSPEKIKKHFSFRNLSVLEDLRDKEHRTVILTLGHCGSWEIFSASPLYLKSMGATNANIYKQLKNPLFDLLEYEMRSRHGALPLEMAETPRYLIQRGQNSNEQELLVVSFLADQSPWGNGAKYATLFFNQPTVFISGWESLARKLHAPVVFLDIRQDKKFHWVGNIELLSPDASQEPPFDLVDRYAQLLEENIIADPSSWLWSHNRWKMDFEWIRPRLTLSPRLQSHLSTTFDSSVS